MALAYNSDFPNVIERDMVINNMNIHVKSIFSGEISLGTAIQNIIIRKMSGAILNN